MDQRRRLVLSTKITTWCCGLIAILGLSFLISSPAVFAVSTVPTKMNFQGRLTNSGGNIVPDGSYNMKFRLFTASSGGSAVWSETRETTSRVTVANGLFSVQLGDVTPISASLFASGNLYLEIELPSIATATCSTTSCASYTEGSMAPRNVLGTSAYSYNSETLDGLDSAAFGQLSANNTFTGQNIFKTATNGAGAFRIQNAAGNDVISVDTSVGSMTLKSATDGAPFKMWGTNTGASNVAVMGVYDSAGARIGYVGDGFTGSASMYLQADAGNTVNLGINGGVSLNVDSAGNVQIGSQNGSMSGHALAVANDGGTPMAVRRNTNDGNLISFYRDATLQGSVSVAGATVSYNAFTGSHYGWINGPAPDRGTLVAMTGDNQAVGEEGKSEIVYGVTPTTIANDPAVLGSYLALSNPAEPFDKATNPHQIMSVGNGDMWVAENSAGNIKPGDELISSNVAGHAMKNPGTYPVSNVVARASEKIDWSRVKMKINGVKHARITVLFGAYTRNTINQVQGLGLSDMANVNNLVIRGHLIGNGDTRGRVAVPAGQTSVTYRFKQPYDTQPFVVASPEGRFVEYHVAANKDSFTVQLSVPSDEDQWFTYMVQE